MVRQQCGRCRNCNKGDAGLWKPDAKLLNKRQRENNVSNERRVKHNKSFKRFLHTLSSRGCKD